MAPKNPLSDRELFLAALALFDRPAGEPCEKPLDEDTDVEAFVERAFAFGNRTIPPM